MNILNEFIIGVIRAADVLQRRRIEREEEEKRREEERRRREEERRRIEIEKAKLQELENQAYLWAKSKQIRAYIEAAENTIANQQLSEDERTKFVEWITWAKQHAERIDPLHNNFPFSNF